MNKRFIIPLIMLMGMLFGSEAAFALSVTASPDNTFAKVNSVTVRLEAFETSGTATIYYTTNNTTPNTASNPSSSPVDITIDSTTTVNFFAKDDSVTTSPTPKTYTIIYTPGKPTGVSATAGNGQASVSFTAPVSTGTYPISGYTVTSSPGNISNSDLSSPITVTGLTNGTTYTFTVTATNGAGTGPPSDPASNSVTPHAAVPGKPTNVAAIAGNAQATVSFSAPSDNGGSAITGYTVYSSPAGGLDTNANTMGTSHTITNLTNGVAYTFTVKATNSVGDSAPSDASASATPKAVTLTPSVGSPSLSMAKSDSTVTYTVTYTGADSITLAATDITLNKTGTANGTVSISGSGATTRTVTISGFSGDGTIGITLTAGTASAGGGTVATPSLPSETFTVDNTQPTLTLTTLANSATTGNNTLTVSGTASDANGIQSITVNGAAVPVADGAYNTALTLQKGSNTLTIIAKDGAGNEKSQSRTIVYDDSAPVIRLNDPTPAAGSSVGQQAVTITGTISEAGTVSVTLNNSLTTAATMNGHNFTAQLSLSPGQNIINVTATGGSASGTVQRGVYFDDLFPSLAITGPGQDITIFTPMGNDYTISGTASGAAAVTSLELKVDGTAVSPAPTLTDGTFQQSIKLDTTKTYSISVIATDLSGNSTTVQRNIIYTPTTHTYDISDAIRALKIAVGIIQKTDQDNVLDVAPLLNGQPAADGNIDTSDALVLLRRTVGLVTW